MAGAETAFNGRIAETFAAHAESVRGHIRYELVRRNLASVIGNPGLRVIDVGGGAGIDAVWLAGLGHEVTVLDPAEDQLARAEERITKLPADVAGRVNLQPGTVDDLLRKGQAHSFDLALSHCVAMYLDEPAEFIRRTASLVHAHGRFSLLEKGYYGAYKGLMHDRKYAAAAELQRTGRLVNRQGRLVWAFKAPQLVEHLISAGAMDLGFNGVRVLHDFDDREVKEMEPAELEDIVSREYRAGRDAEVRGSAPLLHFIATIG